MWTVIACMVFVLVLRAPYLGTPLGVDEGGLAYIAGAWNHAGASLYGSYWLDRPPLLVLLFRAAVVGGAVGIRVLGALAAMSLVAGVALIARAVGGERAGQVAALLAALLGGSVAIHAVYTPAELLAAVPSTFSVLCLVTAVARGQARWLVAAGVLAMSAALIKQSFLDAGLAGAVFLTTAALHRKDVSFGVRWPLAYLAGVALPWSALELWERWAGIGDGQMSYALLGFRLHALRTLAASNLSLTERFTHMVLPALTSGLVLLLAATVIGLARLRPRPVVGLTLAAWAAGGSIGVLAGGSYWSHYLIQLIPVCTVGAALMLATTRPRARHVVLGIATVVACISAVRGAVHLSARIPHDAERDIGAFVRANARPGDTQYVLYARANVLYYAGLPSPYPYLWSLMLRARPDARNQLVKLLASARRPTWIVEWQDDDRWRLDPDGAVDRELRTGYRHIATVCARQVFVRRDRPAPRAGSAHFDCGWRSSTQASVPRL